MYESIKPRLADFAKLAGGKHFVVITRPHRGQLAQTAGTYKKSYRDSYITSFVEQMGEKEKSFVSDPAIRPLTMPLENEHEFASVFQQYGGKYSKEFLRFAIRAAIEKSQTATDEIDNYSGNRSDVYAEESDGKPIGVTYFYSDSPIFQQGLGVSDTDRGVILLTEGDELGHLYDPRSKLPGLLKDISFVFLDDVPMGQTLPIEREGRVILRLPAMDKPDYADLAALAHSPDKSKFAAFLLLPLTRDSALPWNLDAGSAGDFINAGKRLAKKLKASGLAPTYTDGDPISLKLAIEQAVSQGRRPLIIGEAAGDGSFVRLAGSNMNFDPATLSEAARAGTMFLFCNSGASKAAHAGFTIEGRVFSKSVEALIGTLGVDDNDQANSKAKSARATNWISDVVELSGAGTLDEVSVYRFTGRPAPPTPGGSSGIAQVPDPSAPSDLPLLLYGAFGGACVEFFRWRKLLARPHGAVYATPMFIAFSLMFVLLAAGAGFIFGRLVSGSILRSAAAFIFGAGLEEAVKRASRLKAPNVAFSPDGRAKPSLHEFLRG